MKILVIIAIILAFFVLSAYATTDIIRLLKGSTVPVYAPDCYCPECNNKIRLIDQVPIFAYIVNRGKCHYCKCKIPLNDILLEVLLVSVFTITNVITGFSIWSYFITVAEYELTKLIFIITKGKRKDAFLKNLTISLITNLFVFLLVGMLYVMLKIVRRHVG